ncbi:MAG: hypothetical protein WC055_00240 [Melioribacteraceae bacterium]
MKNSFEDDSKFKDILERLETEVNSFQEEIIKLDELVDYFPELAVEATVKKDQLEEIIEKIQEIIEDYS